MLFELIFILPLSIFLRVLFILGKGTDQEFHFLNVQWAKQYGLKHPILPDSVIHGCSAYPALPAFMVSLFPKSMWNAAGRFLNIFYDIVSIMAVYLIAHFFFLSAAVGVEGSGGLFIFSPEGWSTLLYSTSPILYPITARLKAMGGRTIGPMFAIIYFAILGYALIESSYFILILCIPIGILIILSSIFSTQVLTLFSIFLSILLVNVGPLIILSIVLIVGCLLPRLGIKKILLYHYYLYAWYLKRLGKGSPIDDRNRLRNILLLPRHLMRQPVKFVQNIFEHNSFFIGLYTQPAITVLLFWTVSTGLSEVFLGTSRIEWFSWAMIFSGLIAFFLTSFRPFVILGQAERYLEYSSPYIVMLFTMYAFQRNSLEALLLIAFLNVIFVIMNFILIMGPEYMVQLRMAPRGLIARVVEALRVMEEPRILTIPTKLAYLISSHLDHPNASYCYDWISEGNKGFSYMLNDRLLYQYPVLNMNYFKDKYKINALVVQKKALKKAHDLNIQYNFKGCNLLMENEEYLVYKIV